MDELEQNFLSELCNMRLQIAYQRFLKERTAEEADKEQERDNHIEDLYNKVLELCNEEGKELFKEYADEVAYRESDECDFFYLSGVKDGILLQGIIKKLEQIQKSLQESILLRQGVLFLQKNKKVFQKAEFSTRNCPLAIRRVDIFLQKERNFEKIKKVFKNMEFSALKCP